MSGAFSEPVERFREDYARQREQEGRDHKGAELRELPYLKSGPLARQWAVRARTFDSFVDRVLRPLARRNGRPLDVLDLGAGNGWLSYRLARDGHRCTAIDIRDDAIDGLGAARELADDRHFDMVVASFDDLPMADSSMDVAIFNASLHYATDLSAVLSETVRCLRHGGLIAILDSPFYARSKDGEAMVTEKHRSAAAQFGGRASALLALPHIEYLTNRRLAEASRDLDLVWRRHRVTYPLWYEFRPFTAMLSGARRPSRFDFWTAEVP